MKFGVVWAMPSRWTFEIPPIAAFVGRHTQGRAVIVDPFAGNSLVGTHRNDLGRGGVDAELFVRDLIAQGVKADAVIFDPPYSPRQVQECYAGIGREVTMADTQTGNLNRRMRLALNDIAAPGAMALSFGWSSIGMGRDGWETVEILLVQHGGAHNDTICVAQKRRADLFNSVEAA